jgi:nickel/cobalt exporter
MMSLLRLLAPLMVLAMVLLTAVPGGAQQAPSGGPAAKSETAPAASQRSFLPAPGARPAAPPAELGLSGRVYQWLMAVQGDFNQRLARTVREIRSGNPLMATLTLVALSFAYGVVHAAGPGHGKAIISSYVLASDRTVRRGIALSFLAAVFQALSALILVAVLVSVFNATGMARRTTEAWLETLSWGLVAVIGAWLLWMQVRKLAGNRQDEHAHSHGHTHAHADAGRHDHPHQHEHAHSHGHAHAHGHAAVPVPVHGHHDHAAHGHAHKHDPHDGHDHSACCGHAHMPSPDQLEGAWSWRKAIPLALAIGIRPCTGAIAVLIFALSQGMVWAGVLSTLAMALGTAITVSALAVIAVGSREMAVWLGRGSSVWGTRVRAIAGIGGALAVMSLGILLFIGSLSGPTAF